MTEIIMQTYQVLEELKLDPTYQAIKQYDKLIYQKYPDEIQNFQVYKNEFEKLMNEGGAYHPSYKSVSKALSEAKIILYQKPEVLKYFETEEKCQNELNQFLSELTQAVSSHIKTPNKIGIVTKGGSCHVR